MPRSPSLWIFRSILATRPFHGLSARAARSLGRDHLKEALQRHCSNFTDAKTKHLALMWMMDSDHVWSTIRGYDRGGRMHPDVDDDEVYKTPHATLAKWQAREEARPGSQRPAVFFRRKAYTKLPSV
ncbi:hypothetical protein HGRIS_000485 [Hohenbuehelia grisea]|uniref:Uncharacterized protein n=1 Tax=Hohenbuehelia grisea TaxID=104357 RepID=A0ABR3JR61_9AGAR